MKSRIISLVLVTIMIISAMPMTGVFAADESTTTDSILIGETFNDVVTGGVPDDVFTIKRAGSGDLSVVDVPDTRNKSLFMKTESGGTTYIEKSIHNPESAPLTLAFKMMLDNLGSFQLVNIVDSKGVVTPLFDVVDGKIMKDGEAVYTFDKNVWYYVEVGLNVNDKAYTVSVDNMKVIKKTDVQYSDFASIRLQLSATTQELKLDDITMFRADLVTGDVKYFENSYLFLEPILQEEAKDIASKGLLMYQNAKRAVKNGAELELSTPAKSFDKVLYVPLRFAVENLGGEVTWNTQENAAYIVFKNKTHKIKDGKTAVCVDGSPAEIKNAIINDNGTMYMAAEDVAEIMGVPVYTELGFVMIDGEEALYNKAVDLVKEEVKNMIKYPRPTGEELYSALMERFPNNTHPRLYGTKADFDKLKKVVESDDLARGMYGYIKNITDPILSQPPIQRVDVPAREDDLVNERCRLLGFMYQMTGDERYAERCWQEMETVCGYKNWYEPTNYENDRYGKSSNTLPNQAILEGMAFGYDMIHDWMTPAQRKLVAETMMNRSLHYRMLSFKGEILKTSAGGWAYWIDDPLNFNTAHNMSLMSAAIALADVYPEFCTELMEYCTRSLEHHYNKYEPDGAWIEGPDYGYATLNGTIEIAHMYEVAFGTDAGLSNVPGLTEAAYYYQYVLGPTGFFSFSDAGKQTQPRYSFSFYLADKLNDTRLGKYRKQGLIESNYLTMPEELFYYKPELIAESAEDIPLDNFYRGIETAFMRSSWDKDAVYTGLHVDYNRQQHGHVDMGTFVLDAMGEEWFWDIRRDEWHYSYMDGLPYTGRAEGHNTIVIDDTPYTYANTEDGMIPMYNLTFEDYADGETIPASDPRESLRYNYSGTGNLTVYDDPDKENNKYLLMNGNQEGDEKGSSNVTMSLPEPVVGKYEFSFRAKWKEFGDYTNTTNHNGKFFEVGSSLGSNDSNGFYFPFYLNSSGSLYGNTKSGNKIMLPEFKPDVWYDFKVTADITNNTYSLYVDGGAEGGSASLENVVQPSNIPDITYIRFPANTDISIDDILFKIDESYFEMAQTAARRWDQNQYARAYIDEFESKPRGAFAISDITEAFPMAESAVRGVMLGENRNAVIVRDEIKLKKRSDVHWFAHMSKQVGVEIAEDGKSAILSRDGKQLWVGILSDVDAVIELKDPIPMPGSPNPPEQSKNSNVYKLAIVNKGVMDVDMSVAMVPLGQGETAPSKIPEEVALADWSIPEGEVPKLTSLTVDGKPIEGFDANKTLYTVMRYDDERFVVPTVNATADSDSKVTIEQATAIPGSAIITVEKDNMKTTYTVSFAGKALAHGTIRGQHITELDITASRYETEDSAPLFIMDNDFTTRWCSFPKNQWIQIDLHNVVEMSDLDIAWYQGSERKYAFQIFLSEDGVEWTKAFDGASAGKSEEFETFTFDKTYNARYIKVVCNGHETGEYNNISEIR